ncbi:hypothetical protein EV714DRAFT_195317, partial [Schizophyllum commune]
ILDLASGAYNLRDDEEPVWECGVKTRLPRPRLRSTTFPFDEAQVRGMMKFPNARDRPDLVCFLKTGPGIDFGEVMKNAITAQANGLYVIIEGAGTTCSANPDENEDPALDPQYWSDDPGNGVFGVALDNQRQAHDMQKRAAEIPSDSEEVDPDPGDTVTDDPVNEDESADESGDESAPSEPYVPVSIRGFLKNIHNGKHIRAILDIPSGFMQDDAVTKYLSNGHQESSTVSYRADNADYEFRPGDIAKTFDWILLHQAGFLTFGHADATGMGTTFDIRGFGAKLWLVLTCRRRPGADHQLSERELIMQSLKSLYFGIPRRKHRPHQTDDGAGRADFSVDEGCELDGCIIVPGFRIQPPGKGHVVYTPLATVTAGKHYVNWSSLHHMEVCRSFEKHTLRQATNHDHSVAQLMLIFMAAALPARLKQGRVFYKKPLIALCLMVLYPRKYIHAGSIEDRIGKLNDQGAQDFLRRLRDEKGDWVRGPVDRRAQLVCLAVLRSLRPDAFQGIEESSEKVKPELPDISLIRDTYLSEGCGSSKSWQDPGPEVSFGATLDKYIEWLPSEDDAVLGPIYKDMATRSSQGES